eukprot:3841731-Rhodomonas_salina.1
MSSGQGVLAERRAIHGKKKKKNYTPGQLTCTSASNAARRILLGDLSTAHRTIAVPHTASRTAHATVAIAYLSTAYRIHIAQPISVPHSAARRRTDRKIVLVGRWGVPVGSQGVLVGSQGVLVGRKGGAQPTCYFLVHALLEAGSTIRYVSTGH